MQRLTRVLGVLVSLVLLAALVPAAAFADGGAGSSAGEGVATPRVRGGLMRPLGLTPLAADDDIPGLPLGPSAQSGGLSLNDDDWVDVYSFTMAPGQVFTADMQVAPGRVFYMEIFDSSGTTVYDTTGLNTQSLPWDENHDRIQIPTSNTLGGTYYLVVWLGDENPYWGSYSISWQTYTRGGDDDVPGAIAPGTASVSGSLDWRTDASDVYRFDLADNQQLTLELAAGSGAASTVYPVGGLDMYAYQAGSTTAWGDMPTWGVNTTDAGSSSVTKSYYCPPGGAGTVYVEVHAELSAANYTLDWQITDPNNIRLSGANRYETSYEISRANFVSSGVAVLASGSSFPDALCASGLAGALNAPLLLVPPKILDGSYLTDDGRAFRNECLRLGVTQFQVVGGQAAISTEVLDDAELVTGVGSSSRWSGADRYATSASVMNRIVAMNGGPVEAAVVARGDKFADALAAAPFAYAGGYPILLTKTDALPTSVRSSLQAAIPGTVYVLGGTSAVNAAVYGAVDGIVPTVSRIDGPDRYATALNFATFIVDDLGVASWADVGLATGVNFPDALSGGAACGSRGGVLLLTEPTTLNTGVSAKLAEESAGIDRVTIFGGTAAVSSAVRTQVDAVLNP